MVNFITLIKNGFDNYNEVLKDFKPNFYDCGEPQLFASDYLDIDCIQLYNRTWNNKKYVPVSYYTDTLKQSKNYNLVEVKIYNNGIFKVINHGNKYRYQAPK